ncbi:MAG: thiamine-phosphate kinase [Nitrospiraceae bacterium]|nr:thiamine-phosphate kinase [Nitrospiraceae bacterium]
MPKAKEKIHEFALIRQLQRRYPARAPGLIQSIGDDAAVLAPSVGQWWHLTTDLLAEGVHFDLHTASPESIGYRAAMANLSDIAAMGAQPRFLLLSLAIPPPITQRHILQLYAGLMRACRPYGVALIGGDTSGSATGLFVNITLMGTTRTGASLFRRGAHPGDGIYVTGTLGDSLAGLKLLNQGLSSKQTPSLRPVHHTFLVQRHLRPSARVAEGQWLNEQGLATSAIDVSDGLSGDLRHLCEESRVGAEIDPALLPLSPACSAYANLRGLKPADLALAGGEDYELLFTVQTRREAALQRQAATHRYRITRIGEIRERRFGVQMRSSDGMLCPLPMTSYRHFHS